MVALLRRRAATRRSSYHVLLRDILGSLCHRQGNPVYCETEARFTQYLGG